MCFSSSERMLSKQHLGPEEAAVHLCTGLMSIRSTYAKGKLSYLFFSQNSVAEHSSCKPHGTSEWNDCIQNNSKENITYRNLEGIAKAVPREKCIVGFLCQLDWVTGYPDILGVSVRAYRDEINIRIDRPNGSRLPDLRSMGGPHLIRWRLD